MQGSGATGAQQVSRVGGRQFLKPDSALVRTALDLLATHVAEGGAGDSGLCGHCGFYYPCPTAAHARQVVDAGGMPHAWDGPVDGVPDSVIGPVSDGPVESAPDITPQRAPDIAPQRARENAPDTAAEADDQIGTRDRVGVA
jgi:hypothetical protein